MKTVVVLGKPRSGTSLTAEILTVLGVDMGADIAPSAFNPRGDYEDLEFNELNASILAAAGGDQNGVLRIPPRDTIMAQRERFDERIRTFFAAKAKPHLWGWKKPSTSLLIELFLPHLNGPHFVVVLRNPIGAAESLVEYVRRWKPVTFEEMLRTTNVIDGVIFDFLQRHPELPRIFVAFEDIVGEPVREARRLASFVGVALDDEKVARVERLIIPRAEIARLAAKGFLKSLPAKARTVIRKIRQEPRRAPEYVTQSLRLVAGVLRRSARR